MMVRVVAFGPLTDVLNEALIELSLPATSAEVKQQITAALPAIAGTRFSLAVDDRLASEDERIETAREVALLPPFAGG